MSIQMMVVISPTTTVRNSNGPDDMLTLIGYKSERERPAAECIRGQRDGANSQPCERSGSCCRVPAGNCRTNNPFIFCGLNSNPIAVASAATEGRACTPCLSAFASQLGRTDVPPTISRDAAAPQPRVAWAGRRAPASALQPVPPQSRRVTDRPAAVPPAAYVATRRRAGPRGRGRARF